ncbi:MAG: ROK family protein [Patescibacteria group bacterium]
MKEKYIGLDIGASKINGVVFDGQLQKQVIQAVSSKTEKAEILKQIKEIIKELFFSHPDIKGIGIGMPGPLDVKKNIVLNPPNLKGLAGLNLAEELGKEFDIGVLADNDGNCAALGESLFGMGKDLKNGILIMLTLGSGVGGGIIINNKIFHGSTGSAGELGHMVINADGPECGCGFKGCLEVYASEKFFKRHSDLSPLEIEEKARKGDEASIKLYSEMGFWLGLGLANIVNIFDPDIVALGGGISHAGELILKPAGEEMQKRVLSVLAKKNVKIEQSSLNKDAGAIGAASLFL